MGASGWSCQVPYQPDIAAALEQARAEAYRDGDFYRETPDPKALELTEEQFLAEHFGPGPADEDDPGYEEVQLAWRSAHVTVTGPDSLLEAQPFSGAHSVIDMTDVAAYPEFGAVAPLPDADLDRWFGTRQPDSPAVEKALREGLDGFGRWCGAYVIAYADGAPSRIHFFGWSGD